MQDLTQQTYKTADDYMKQYKKELDSIQNGASKDEIK